MEYNAPVLYMECISIPYSPGRLVCIPKASSLHEGVNSLTQAEVNHAPGSYVYSMGILYGANFNMADRTAGQLESTLRVSNACAKAFEARTS